MLKKISRRLEIARFCHKVHPLWRPGYSKVYSRALHICRQWRFEPYEAYRLGLFKPDFDLENLNAFISRKALTKIQERFNPPALAELAKNKGLFYYHCLKNRIPVAPVFVISTEPAQLWHCTSGKTLQNLQEKIEFLNLGLPEMFVIKPLYGAYGKSIYVFDKFIDHLNKSYTVKELLSFIESNYPDGFIIQQKVENHPEIVSLTGCRALQTVRMITFVDNTGQARILHSHFKPITKPGIVIDTHIEGLTGNVEVPVDIDSGILSEGNRIGSNGPGITTIAKHPLTNHFFGGFKMPLWREACETVKRAAIDFLPLRTIGWDVAISAERTYIIEANVWWDPPNQHRKMSEILKQMQD